MPTTLQTGDLAGKASVVQFSAVGVGSFFITPSGDFAMRTEAASATDALRYDTGTQTWIAYNEAEGTYVIPVNAFVRITGYT